MWAECGTLFHCLSVSDESMVKCSAIVRASDHQKCASTSVVILVKIRWVDILTRV